MTPSPEWGIDADGAPQVLPCHHVILCTGHESHRPLEAPLRAAGLDCWGLGGGAEARGLDAKSAIAEGMRLATEI